MKGFEWHYSGHGTKHLEWLGQQAAFDSILDACLEDIRLNHASVSSCLAKFPAQASELCPLLEMAAELHSVNSVKPTWRFRQATRRLVLNLPDPDQSPPIAILVRALRNVRARFLVAAALLTLILTAAVGVAVASNAVLPGSPLYSVKRQTENIQLLFQTDNASAALTRAAFADRRLEEAQALAGLGQTQLAEQATVEYGEQVTLAVDSLRSVSHEAVQPSAEQLSAQLQREQQELTRNQASASAAQRQVLDHALALSAKATEQLALVVPFK